MQVFNCIPGHFNEAYTFTVFENKHTFFKYTSYCLGLTNISAG